MSTTNLERPTRCLPALEEHAADPLVEDVVLATDGGEASVGAMKWLARRSRLHRLNVTVMTVVEADWMTVQLDSGTLERAAEECLDASETYLARVAPSAEVRTVQAWGEPREEFARASQGADLLVVGSNRTSGLSSVLGASFSTKLAEGADCPVVVVPRTWRAGKGAVVVGVQGDGSDEAAIRLAVREARIMHRELRIVHSWSYPPILAPIAPLDEETPGVVDAHDSLLQGVVGRVRRENPTLSVSAVLAEGHPGEVLAREAQGGELLVVGSHGWTLMDRFFIGSVSREIISRPPCPVAVVRPFDKEVER